MHRELCTLTLPDDQRDAALHRDQDHQQQHQQHQHKQQLASQGIALSAHCYGGGGSSHPGCSANQAPHSGAIQSGAQSEWATQRPLAAPRRSKVLLPPSPQDREGEMHTEHHRLARIISGTGATFDGSQRYGVGHPIAKHGKSQDSSSGSGSGTGPGSAAALTPSSVYSPHAAPYTGDSELPSSGCWDAGLRCSTRAVLCSKDHGVKLVEDIGDLKHLCLTANTQLSVADKIKLTLEEVASQRGRGGRHPAGDPRLQDPSLDPKKVRRILANRESAARSKMRQKLQTAELRAQQRVLSARLGSMKHEKQELERALSTLSQERARIECELQHLEQSWSGNGQADVSVPFTHHVNSALPDQAKSWHPPA